MENVAQLVEYLLTVERQLEQLSRQYAELYKKYDGDDFSEQKLLASDKLDNLILAATHENASVIGFQRQAILDLCQYIAFRKTYLYFNDEELSLIIDSPDLTAPEKLILRKKCADSTTLESIKTQWNQLFNNKNYRQVKISLKI
jgi:hypothetical protein